jgi:hypothetical protein
MTPSQAVTAANAENEAENARACAAEASLDLVEQLLEGYFMQVSRCNLPLEMGCQMLKASCSDLYI